MSKNIIIIGGGIAGLSVAYRLEKLFASDPPNITLLEKSGEIGGKIRTSSFLGHQIDEAADAFHAPRPIDDVTGQVLNSWTLNTTTYLWEPPTPCPETYDDGRSDTNEAGEEVALRDLYDWNEDTLTWDKISS